MTLQQELEGKRVGVVLSAGYFGFFGHAGFVRALAAAKVRVAAWAGTSAGGLVAAFAASGNDPSRLEDLLRSTRREDFWDPDLLGMVRDAVGNGPRAAGLLGGRRFRGLLERHLPRPDFSSLAAPLVLVATDLSTRAPHRMESGELASAVHATCAYPGLFQPVRRGASLLWDGGLVDKAPALALVDALGPRALDAVLVHYLPSRDGQDEPSGPFAWMRGMTAGVAALRRDHFRLQLEVLRARGVAVHVVTSQLPPVSPSTLSQGMNALEAGRRAGGAALGAPSRPFSAGD